MWRADKMNHASILEVEEALLAIHVASNGSQESTDPNCSFRLQDPRGIQGLEGRFRIRTQFAGPTRARPASATTATMRASSAWVETTMHASSSSPACWSTHSSSSLYAACIDAAPPAARVLGSAAASLGGTADDVSGRAFGFMAQGWRRHGGDGREIVSRRRRAPACAMAAAAY